MPNYLCEFYMYSFKLVLATLHCVGKHLQMSRVLHDILSSVSLLLKVHPQCVVKDVVCKSLCVVDLSMTCTTYNLLVSRHHCCWVDLQEFNKIQM